MQREDKQGAVSTFFKTIEPSIKALQTLLTPDVLVQIQTKVSLTDPRFLEMPGTLADKISQSISESITTLHPTSNEWLLSQ